MNILLMTGTIRPFVKIKYNNTSVRYNEYMNNIKKYIKESDFDKIIFAENSGYAVSENTLSELRELANKNCKEFEYLELVDEKSDNISVGDANIIKRALKESKIIEREQVSSIWKISGRIWINNINQILSLSKDKENIFLYAPKYHSIQTWLFKTNIEHLNKFFLSNQAVRLMETSCIEYVFFAIFQKNKDKIHIDKFPLYPDVQGINSSGEAYTMPRWKLILKNIALQLGYFKVK